MHVNYKINGVDNRDIRLEHCRKLASRWAAINKVKVDTPMAVNVMFVTVQRACDQDENRALLAYANPSASFSRAWVTFLAAAALAPLFALYLRRNPGIARGVMNIIFRQTTSLARLSLRGSISLLIGVMRLFQSITQSEIIHPFARTVSTLIASLSRRLMALRTSM
jgi:hypothetical protein